MNKNPKSATGIASTVTGKDSFVKTSSSEKAKMLGKDVHSIIELWLMTGTFCALDDNESVNAHVRGFIKAWNEQDYNAYLCETLVFCRQFDYFGNIDVIARKGKERHIIELKTGKYDPMFAFTQLRAYALALDEQNVEITHLTVAHIRPEICEFHTVPWNDEERESTVELFKTVKKEAEKWNRH